ncbi:ribosylnicotinamide kinase homolog [Nonlabens ulvanivorans]|uniref:Ribosylnicotinamide kinase homolog n=1 Tax=Nonlabens ulvanivorans TaxID=906888 RepID=A0A090Q8B5_NONUL|nr:ribosylnicotinamide kinase homolog [Nonlabens ulvanivorans]
MNLNELDADIIFIKNIDNVTVSSLEQEVGDYKKSLAGLLLTLQEQCFKYLRLIDENKVDEILKAEIEEFLMIQLSAVLPSDYKKYAREFQLEYLFNRLNRPLRVCGMVKNEGEPGGGPFGV